MANEYRYPELDYSNEDTYRVLSILPGRTDLIKCKLDIVPLASDHICLSYRWNTAGERKAIKVNGAKFYVYSNVWDFLFMAREKYPGRKFWIDAICINQANVSEKNHQVPQMGRIYTQASQIIVWLWPTSEATQNAMSLVEERVLPIMLVPQKAGEPWYFLKWPALPILLSMRDMKIEAALQPRKIPSQAIQKAIRSLWVRGTDLIRDCQKAMDELEAFFTDPYWGRAWIVQEIMSNDHVVVVNGNTEMKWFDFYDYSQLWTLVSSKWEYGLIHNHVDTVNAWPFTLRRGISQEARVIELIQQFCHQKCEDFHDNVYALRALAKDRHRIKVDYTFSEEEFTLQIMPLLHNAMDSPCFFDGLAESYANLKVIETLKQKSILPHLDRHGRWSLDWHKYSFSFDRDTRPYLVFERKLVKILGTQYLSTLKAAEQFGWRQKWNRPHAQPLRQLLESWMERGIVLAIHDHAFFLFTPETEFTMRCVQVVVPYFLEQTVLWKCRAVFGPGQVSGITARQVNKFTAYYDKQEWAIEMTRGAAFRFFMITESKERCKCENQTACSLFHFMA